MKFIRFSKFAAAALVIAAGAGCETMPGDPYYADRYAPTPVYGGSAMYPGGAYPVYPAYPAVRRDRQDRWEDMRNDRERQAWRERQAVHERERERLERDARARRDLERQRDRDVARHNQELRERELAQRQREARAQASRNSRNSDGSPRTDYDRYNPKTGQWMPRSEDMP